MCHIINSESIKRYNIIKASFTAAKYNYDLFWAIDVKNIHNCSINENFYMFNLDNGQQYVDLELQSCTIWAKYNFGANADNLTGGYYAWGELTEKDAYTADGYTFGKPPSLTKYNTNAYYGDVDNRT